VRKRLNFEGRKKKEDGDREASVKIRWRVSNEQGTGLSSRM